MCIDMCYTHADVAAALAKMYVSGAGGHLQVGTVHEGSSVPRCSEVLLGCHEVLVKAWLAEDPPRGDCHHVQLV